MEKWTFYDYIEPTGRIPFLEWLVGLPDEAQAAIDARILMMTAVPRWSEKWISKYKTTDKVYELRIPFQKVQYRPLGCYKRGWSFVLLAGAIEKDGKLPKEIVSAADQRQKILEKEPHRVREHRFS